MRIDATGLIFGEECRVFHLSDIMVERTGTYKLALCTDTYRCFSCQIGHLHGVLEGSRNGFRHPAQQVVVDVRQFHQRHVGSESESLFQQE